MSGEDAHLEMAYEDRFVVDYEEEPDSYYWGGQDDFDPDDEDSVAVHGEPDYVEGEVYDLPGMWEQADLIGGETDEPE